MATTNMDLSVLKLVSPHRRSVHMARSMLENDSANSAGKAISPREGGPPSPIWNWPGRLVVDDEMFAIFDENRAAVPFKWEETPGIPLGGADEDNAKVEIAPVVSESETTNNSAISRSTSCSKESSDCTSEKAEEEEYSPKFEFSRIHFSEQLSVDIPDKSSGKFADDLFANGQILPLKPPPGMQHSTLDNDDGNRLSFSSRSLNSLMNSNAVHRRSFRRDGLKALPFLNAPRKEGNQNDDYSATMLGFEEWTKVTGHAGEQDSLGVRSKSMSRFTLSFRKKASTENGKNSESDDIFDQDFGLKGGLRERKDFTSVSSRGIADGYDFKGKGWSGDHGLDFNDSDSDTKADCSFMGTSQRLSGEDSASSEEKKQKKKQKRHRALARLSNFFRYGQRNGKKNPRSSSVSPAPILRPVLAELTAKNQKQTASPKTEGSRSLAKTGFPGHISRSLFRNVRHFGHLPSRFIAAK